MSAQNEKPAPHEKTAPHDKSAETAELPILSAPADPVPAVVDTPSGLAETANALATGNGPVAVDAERAHGYRYSARAYLLQLRRAGGGTHLIDPIPLVEAGLGVTDLLQAIGDAEWIIHAATQDTPCLAELGLLPKQLFDTELAGRLLGFPRVALGSLIERYFGVRLLKEHSAADWSTRPLPPEWLNYAALDVELLVELRDRLAEDLRDAGKLEWARQEFAWLADRAGAPTPARVDPWRRTSGIHGVRSPAGLAVVRELWQVRDELARRLDRAPGRIVPDKAIAELAARAKPNRRELQQIAGFQRRSAKRYETNWVNAIDRALALPKSQLPPIHLPAEGPPPPRTWESRDPEAFARHQRMRAVMTELAEAYTVPAENLCTPEYWRRLAWQPPAITEQETVDSFLAAQGARQWQRAIVVGPLTATLQEPSN